MFEISLAEQHETSEQFPSQRMTKVRLHSAAGCYERNGRKDNPSKTQMRESRANGGT
jgi:hypothetical protein